MTPIFFALQIISGIITVFFVLVKEPKAEGLGAIGSSAQSFKGVRTSADDKLDKMTWFFAGIFLISSFYLGLIAR
ncbi:MAG: preprotein translocase subunit SecG [Candidatus Caenarcaniphilales bacterium]|jgi:protein translocase SecG subunit|nr:preprotein translocase subunit SecG [Candidatus Caenarcaniphilales bacterium]